MAEQTLRELMYTEICSLANFYGDETYSSGRWGNCKEYLYKVALGEDSTTKRGKKEVHSVNPTEPKLLDMLSDKEFLDYYHIVIRSFYTQR